MTHIQNYLDFHLYFPKLDKESLQIQVFSDALFASNHIWTLQFEYFVFLKYLTILNLFTGHYKSNRATRSGLGSKFMAFADAFDMFFTIKYDLKLIIKRSILFSMLTDSCSFSVVLTKPFFITENRLMNDLQTVKYAYQSFEVNDVAFIQ